MNPPPSKIFRLLWTGFACFLAGWGTVTVLSFLLAFPAIALIWFLRAWGFSEEQEYLIFSARHLLGIDKEPPTYCIM